MVTVAGRLRAVRAAADAGCGSRRRGLRPATGTFGRAAPQRGRRTSRSADAAAAARPQPTAAAAATSDDAGAAAAGQPRPAV